MDKISQEKNSLSSTLSTGGKLTRVRICAVADFQKDGGKVFRVGALQLALFRSEGKYYATANHCSHEDEELHEGWLDGSCVECPRHGAMFDLQTGAALSLPATEPIAVYPVHIEVDSIFVEIPSDEPKANGG